MSFERRATAEIQMIYQTAAQFDGDWGRLRREAGMETGAFSSAKQFDYDPETFLYYRARAITADTSNCFVAGTRVLLEDGTTCAIEDIAEGDTVITQKGNAKTVVTTFKRNYTGTLYKIKILGLPEPLIVTENHKVFGISGLDQIKHNAYKKLWRKGERNIYNPEQYMDWDTCPIEDIAVADLTKDSHVAQPNKFNITLSDDLAAIKDDLFIARLWGYYLADGCLAKRTGTDKPRGIILVIHKEKKIEILNDVLAHITDTKHVAHSRDVKDSPNVTRIEITWPELSELFLKYTGQRAHTKFIHPVLTQMPEDWKLNFLMGYFSGDGCFAEDSNDFSVNYNLKSSSVSYDLTLGLKYLLASVNIFMAANKTFQKAGAISEGNHIYEGSIGASQLSKLIKLFPRYEEFIAQQGLDYEQQPCIRKAYIKDVVLTRISSIELIEVTDVPVYNIEVEDDHSYVANGACVHNMCNGDFFPLEEVEPAYSTFIGKGVYLNHDNNSLEKAFGLILDAVWHKDAKYVEILCALDKELAEQKHPGLINKVSKGLINSTSMSCSCSSAKCGVCNNVAHDISGLCAHMNPKSFNYIKGKRANHGEIAYEINYGLTFTEDSLVYTPADSTAHILQVWAKQAETAPVSEYNLIIKAAIREYAKKIEDAIDSGKLPELLK